MKESSSLHVWMRQQTVVSDDGFRGSPESMWFIDHNIMAILYAARVLSTVDLKFKVSVMFGYYYFLYKLC